MAKFKKIGVVADKRKEAQSALKTLCKKYSLTEITDIEQGKKMDVIVALGGDGFMLHTLHNYMNYDIPIYGINCGTIGFLMNEYKETNLKARLEKAGITEIHPLKMVATTTDGKKHEALAINEVSLLRATGQAVKIRISVDGKVQLKELVGDGVLVATAAGSTAYNSSVGGPALPLKSNLFALTPISAFRPRRWNGALLPHKTTIKFDIISSKKRPANAVADFTEVEDVSSVEVKEVRDKKISLLFDHGHSLEERIISEQFVY